MPAGFEGTGIVVAGDTPLRGRRVAFFAGRSGSWAEYALASADTLIPLRDDVSDDDAAGLIVNPITAAAMFGIAREAGAPAFVATAASSQLGKFLMALGRDDGLPGIAVVRRAAAVPLVEAAGAAAVLVSEAPDFRERLRTVLAEYRPTVLLDAVSGPVSAEIFFAMPEGALWVPYGRLSAEPPVLDRMAQFIFAAKRIEGFWLSPWMRTAPRARVAATVAEVQARFATGRWRTAVSATVPLARAMEDLPAAYGQTDSKVLIAP